MTVYSATRRHTPGQSKTALPVTGEGPLPAISPSRPDQGPKHFLDPLMRTGMRTLWELADSGSLPSFLVY